MHRDTQPGHTRTNTPGSGNTTCCAHTQSASHRAARSHSSEPPTPAPVEAAHLPAVGAEGEAAPPAAHGAAAAAGLPGPRPARGHLGNASPARRPGSGRPRPRSSCPAAAQKGPLVRAAFDRPAGGAARGRHPLPSPREPRDCRIRALTQRPARRPGSRIRNPQPRWSAPCARDLELPSCEILKPQFSGTELRQAELGRGPGTQQMPTKCQLQEPRPGTQAMRFRPTSAQREAQRLWQPFYCPLSPPFLAPA